MSDSETPGSDRPRPWVEAFAPATVSNLGPGFDVLGVALTELGDRVRARRSATPGVHLVAVHGDEGRLPKTAEENTAGVAVLELFSRVSVDSGVELELFKGLPLGSGLGSSGASACAALVATCAALDMQVPVETLIECARVGEEKACGSAHPDNVAPCLAGGMVLIPSEDPLRILRLPTPDELWFVAYTPGCEVKTADARAVLPKSVPLSAAVRQAARLAAMVHALHLGDLELLGEFLADDIVEPARAGLIPGFLDAKATVLEAGALACTISGAGPTTFALARSRERAEVLLQLLDDAYTQHGVAGQGHISRAGTGAHIISGTLH